MSPDRKLQNCCGPANNAFLRSENGSAAVKSVFLQPGFVSGAVNSVFGPANSMFWRLQNGCGPANAGFLGSEMAPER